MTAGWGMVRRLAVVLITLAIGCSDTGEHAPGADIAAVPDDAITDDTDLGPVFAEVAVFPPAPTIGDEVILVLKVVAKDGVTVTMPAFGEALGRFDLVGFAEDTRAVDEGTAQIQRYTLQATRSGPTRIPRLRIEFVDHRPGQDDQTPREVLTEPISLKVSPIGDPAAMGELPGPLPALARRPERGSKTWLHGALLGLAALLVALAVWLWRRGNRRGIRHYAPHEIALARLDELLRAGIPDQTAAAEAFYVALSDIVRRYLDGRFGLRAPERTTEELCAAAQTRGDITPPHRQLIAEFLAQCDRVKFASAASTADESRAAFDAARRLVEETKVEAAA